MATRKGCGSTTKTLQPEQRSHASPLLSWAHHCSSPVPSRPAPHGRRAAWGGRQVFILAGQSNTSGRAASSMILGTERHRDPSIQRLSAALRWEEARDLLHADIDVYAVRGVGPGRARGLEEVGLLACAVGASRKETVGEGDAAVRADGAEGQGASAWGGSITALLWYQGKSDAILLEDAAAYRIRG